MQLGRLPSPNFCAGWSTSSPVLTTRFGFERPRTVDCPHMWTDLLSSLSSSMRVPFSLGKITTRGEGNIRCQCVFHDLSMALTALLKRDLLLIPHIRLFFRVKSIMKAKTFYPCLVCPAATWAPSLLAQALRLRLAMPLVPRSLLQSEGQFRERCLDPVGEPRF